MTVASMDQTLNRHTTEGAQVAAADQSQQRASVKPLFLDSQADAKLVQQLR
jgi:hypothetical protein